MHFASFGVSSNGFHVMSFSYFQNEFRWSDGSVFNLSSYENWFDGEPNNDFGNGEHCVHVYDRAFAENLNIAIGDWNDYDCSTLLPYICGPGMTCIS